MIKIYYSSIARFALLLSVLLPIAGIAFNAVSLALPRWLIYTVNSTTQVISPNLTLYQTRSRGLFLECLQNTSSLALLQRTPKYTSCFEIELGQFGSSDSADSRGTDGFSVILLRRWHIGLQVSAGVLLIISLLSILLIDSAKTPALLIGSAIAAIYSSGFHAASLGVFGAFLLREHTEFARPEKNSELYSAWPSLVKSGTTVTYGLCFYLSWASLLCALLSAFLQSLASVTLFLDNYRYVPKDSDKYTHGNDTNHFAMQNSAVDGDQYSHSSSKRLPRTPAFSPPPTYHN